MHDHPILNRHYPMPVRNPIKRFLMYVAIFTLPCTKYVYRLNPKDEPDRALTLLLWIIRFFFWAALVLNSINIYIFTHS